ncbi:hypothetical protein VTH06DRAFT_4407 [Thermothelomyces fergusii]
MTRRPSTSHLGHYGHPQRYQRLRQPSQATSVEDLPASAERGLGIPQKAASLLGMDDPGPATTAHQQQQHCHQEQQPTTSRRRLTPRSRGRRISCTLAGLIPFSTGPNTASDGGDGWWPLPPRSAASHGPSGGHAGGMGELLAGLRRCVHLLVATMRAPAAACAAVAPRDGETEALADDEVGSILPGTEPKLVAEPADGVGAVEPVLVRALCEVVRCAEEGSLEGL